MFVFRGILRAVTIVGVLLVSWSCNDAHAQTLTVHNLAHQDAALFLPEVLNASAVVNSGQKLTIPSGEVGTMQTFAGVEYACTVKTGIRFRTVGQYTIPNEDAPVVFITDDGIFAPGDIVLLESLAHPGKFVNDGPEQGQLAISDDLPNSLWVIRKGTAGEGVSFESARYPGTYIKNRYAVIERGWDASKPSWSAWRLFPGNGKRGVSLKLDGQHYLWTVATPNVFGARFGTRLPDRVTVGLVKQPSASEGRVNFRVVKEYDYWATSEQPSRGQKNKGKLVQSANAEGFVGKITCDQHCRRGYNVLKLNPFNLQEQGTTNGYADVLDEFDPNAERTYYLEGDFRIPRNLIVTPANEGAGESKEATYFSHHEMKKGFAVSVGVQGQAGDPEKAGSSVGLNGSYEQMNSKMDESKTAINIASKWSSHMWLTWDKDEMTLDRKFLNTLAEMDPSRYEDYRTLFEKYGTHYALSTLFGGRATFESKYEMEKIGDTVSETYGGSVEAKGKSKKGGGGGSLSLKFTNETTKGFEKSFNNTKFHRNGGTGETMEAWSKGAPEDWVPIKVDLRPISDLIRPEFAGPNVSPEMADQLDAIRIAMPGMLDQYIEKESNVLSSDSFRPMVFTFEFISANCTESDDSGGYPDLWGSINLELCRTDKFTEVSFGNFRPKSYEVQKSQNAWKATVDNYNNSGYFSTLPFSPTASFGVDPVSSTKWTTVIQPRIVKVQERGKVVVKPEFDLDKYFFRGNIDLVDDDDIEDEKLNTYSDHISLADVAKRGFVEVVEKRDVADLGKMEFTFHAWLVNYQPQSDDLSMPDFPNFTIPAGASRR